ncbi:hypothetical protein [Microbacterium sp. NPDC087665]|uniref:hypothetical protein n=1 Tax=Microbacterium sp. NPDC087665 TaxID=3364194 RepID=UPI0038257042
MTALSTLHEAAEDFTPDRGELMRARGHDLHRVRWESTRRMRMLSALAEGTASVPRVEA